MDALSYLLDLKTGGLKETAFLDSFSFAFLCFLQKRFLNGHPTVFKTAVKKWTRRVPVSVILLVLRGRVADAKMIAR